MKRIFLTLSFFFLTLTGGYAQQIQVSPSSVNAYSQGATTVFLTFTNVKDKRAVDSCWCGDLVSAAPDIGLRCNQANLFGCLPARYDQSRASANSTYTDIMSIPPAVARRAYLDAASGAEATFFYVRRFVSTTGGPDEFVPVTIRLGGNNAAAPLSLTDVKLAFEIDKPVLFLQAGEKVPRLQAEITYTGSGRLKGRWELVKPGEELPAERDLLTEASLPVEERGLQRRYTQLSRFNIYLPPTGRFTLPGPETWKLQNPAEGMYLILLRIEASDDKTSDSVLSGGNVVHAGGVAGFPMPVLRYYIGSGTGNLKKPEDNPLDLLLPTQNAVLPAKDVVVFKWKATQQAAFYRLEIEDEHGTIVMSAILPRGASEYRGPSFLKEDTEGMTLRWRVLAFDQSGTQVAETARREFQLVR
jgi:hypothetical protein